MLSIEHDFRYKTIRWVMGFGSNLIEDVNAMVTKQFINKHKTVHY